MRDEELKQALNDKETAENNLKECLADALKSHTTQQILEEKSQEWEEEKAQMFEQIRRYKTDGDTKSSALAQEKERVAGLEQQLAISLGLREENNKLTVERDNLDVKVLHADLYYPCLRGRRVQSITVGGVYSRVTSNDICTWAACTVLLIAVLLLRRATYKMAACAKRR